MKTMLTFAKFKNNTVVAVLLGALALSPLVNAAPDRGGRGDRDRPGERGRSAPQPEPRDSRPAPAPAPARHAAQPAPAPVKRPAPPPMQRHPRHGYMNRPHWTGTIWLTPPRILLRGAPVVWFDLDVPTAYVRLSASTGWMRVEADLVRWYDAGGARRYSVYGASGWYEPFQIRFTAPTPEETPVVWSAGASVVFWSGGAWVTIAPEYVRVNPRGGYFIWQRGAWVSAPAGHVVRRPAPPSRPAPAPAPHRR